MSDTSIITVYYNTPQEVQNLHQSVRKFLQAGQYDFVVVDNHSQQELSSQLPGATYLRMPENYGFGKANNLAAQRVSSRFLFFVNPDCEFVEDCVAPLAAALQKAAVAGPRVLNLDGSIQLSYGPFLSIFQEPIQKIRTRFEKSVLLQNWLRKKAAAPFDPDYISGCALMIRADVFYRLGGFDENFFLYEEDVDLCKRARQANLRVTYVPSTTIIHARNRSTSLEKDRVNLEYRKSQLYYYQKHHGPLQNLFLRLYLSTKFILNNGMLKWIWKAHHRRRVLE